MDYIFIDPKEKIKLVKCTVSEGDGANLYGEFLSQNDTLYKGLMQELEFDFHSSVLKLNQCARNISGNTEGPNILYLSNSSGGFSRTGISIKQGSSYINYPDLNFVDLELNGLTEINGELQIFSHELGHVMMENLIPGVASLSKCSLQHCSMGITDYFMAFFEGFGEHFERLAYENVKKYKNLHDNMFLFDRQIPKLWHSSIDSDNRIDSVFKNKYIYKKLLPEIDLEKCSTADIILSYHVSPIYDNTHLLSGQQMLSCEGVIAALFYRINTNKLLQSSYLPKDIVNKFLLKNLSDDISPEDLFTPFENVMLKNFWVWTLIKDKITENSIPFIEYIKCWCDCFPGDKEELIKIFIASTIGKTATCELSDIYEELSFIGMKGDIDNFMRLYKEYTNKFDKICKMIVNGNLELDKRLGKELWLKNNNIMLPQVLWEKTSEAPLMVNINTASIYEFMSFPDISLNRAKDIITQRKQKGFFSKLNEVNLSK